MNKTNNKFINNLAFFKKIIFKKPVLIKKLLTGYLNAYIKRKPRLRFMDISLSYDCNMKCQHCSANILNKSKGKKMTVNEYSMVANQAMEAGVMAFHFTGGEPLLKENIFDIIRSFKPHENLISIQTNGWYVNEEFLDSYIKIGGDILCVSVDSIDPREHDEFRGIDGSWEKAIEALKLASGKGLKILMSSTITHFNLKSEKMKALIAFSSKLGAILALNLAVPAGEWRGEVDNLLDKQDREEINRIIRKYPHVRTDFESNWKTKGCPAFKEKCYLTPYGDVMPCPFIHISFGNVRYESIKEIQNKALKFQYLQKYHKVCIAAEDKYFIENAGCYHIDSSLLPVDHSKSLIFGKQNYT